MKTKNRLYILLVALFVGFSSCEDFLDNPPTGEINGAGINDENIDALTYPLYNLVWSDFNGQFYYALGDGRSYNLNAPYSDYIYPFADFNENGLTGPLVNAWGSLYIVIQQANKVIKTINASTVAEETKQEYIAVARFMRGTAYWHLASLWGNAIISEDPTPLTQNPVVNTNPTSDVYEFAIRDLEYAAKYLPERAALTGQINKYAAYAMLSRVYLHYSGFIAAENAGRNYNAGSRDASYLELAKKAAEKVINNGGFSLMADYDELFMVKNNNNSESIFALQWDTGRFGTDADGGWGYINSQQAYFAFSGAVTGDDAAWGGGGTGFTYNALKEFVDEGDRIRRRATYMGYGDHYPEIDQANGGLTYDGNYGINETSTGSGAASTLNVKKGVTGKPADNNGRSGRMNSALNTYMIRYAEVLLNYAEATLGDNTSTSDDKALEYFNAVRTRVNLAPKTSLTWEDIRKERRLEFCMEGRYWYDLVARAYYKRQEVVNYLIGQERSVVPSVMFTSFNIDPTGFDNLRINPDIDASSRAVGTIDDTVFLLPYPSSEITQNPLLNKEPVSYEFSDERITDLF